MSGTVGQVIVLEDGIPLVSLYQIYDGYVEGLGIELATFLFTTELVNGIGADHDRGAANGAGCLAAQLVKTLKTCVGNVYLGGDPHAPDGDVNYVIEINSDKIDTDHDPIKIKLTSESGLRFTGNVSEFLRYVNETMEQPA